MKNVIARAMMLGCAYAALTVTALPVAAEKAGSNILYQGGKKAYDRKIERAAIRRAAEKIGELRGSLQGFESGYIVLEEEMQQDQSSDLGFPLIGEQAPDGDTLTGSVPII